MFSTSKDPFEADIDEWNARLMRVSETLDDRTILMQRHNGLYNNIASMNLTEAKEQLFITSIRALEAQAREQAHDGKPQCHPREH